MDISEQEHVYLVQTVAARPIAEALPIFLKLTGQKLVPDERKQPGTIVPIDKGQTGGKATE